MPFFWKPKENGKKRTKHTPQHMRAAVLRVVESNQSVRSTATDFNIDRKTLERYVKKYRLAENKVSVTFVPNYNSGQVFTNEMENLLADYLKTAAKLHYGMSQKTIRAFVFEFGNANNIRMPENWSIHKKASYDWVRGFMHRHKTLSLRTPRSTSLSRATAFNRVTVGEFFTNLKALMAEHKFEPQSIFNIDETGITTVHVPGRVIAEKGSKEVSKVTSGERGTLVTVCCAVSAIGSSVPPFFVFPRVRVKDTMTKGAPPGSKAVAYQSGWMTGDNFEIYWEHFLKFVKCTKESPVLVIIDNHDSHITPKGIQKCKDNGIILLTIPPHTSHKLQPLDRSVFGPFKAYVNQASDDFMVNNPGKPITIYDIPEIVAKAFPKATTPENITKGFLKTGICPLNSNIFTDVDFMGSYVTDRPDPTAPPNTMPGEDMPRVLDPPNLPSTSSTECSTLNCLERPIALGKNLDLEAVSPEEVRPFPKAGPRKSGKGRRPGRTLILTSTPVKTQIEEEYKKKLEKKKLQESKKCEKRKKVPLKKKVPKKLKFSSIQSDSDISDFMDSDYSDPDNDLEDFQDLEEQAVEVSVGTGDFVLVKFAGKKSISHFAGLICKEIEKDNEYEVIFLRRKDSGQFSYPEKEDRSVVSKSDVVSKLPVPLSSGGTERVALKMLFDFDFTHFENVQ